MKLLMKKEWKLTVTPVPLLFLLLSALVLVPSYPYYVTFFYNALGIFLMLQAARENRDVYYMALLPVTKRDVVRARFLDSVFHGVRGGVLSGLYKRDKYGIMDDIEYRHFAQLQRREGSLCGLRYLLITGRSTAISGGRRSSSSMM